MERVSVRDLKNRLSAYLRRVESGARVVVTDRGQPIAELGPVQPADVSPEEALRRMADAGEVLPPQGKGFSKFRPLAGGGAPLSEAIEDGRRDRF